MTIGRTILLCDRDPDGGSSGADDLRDSRPSALAERGASGATRVLVLDGPCAGEGTDRCFAGDRIHVGREDPADPRARGMLNLWLDLTVSRRHATLGANAGGPWIEDHGSRAGTMAGDRRVTPGVREAIPFGLPIRAGLSTFTLVPQSWICLTRDDFILYGPLEDVLTSALVRSGAPVLGPLVAYCRARDGSRRTTLQFEIPGYADPCPIEIPPLAPETFVEIEVPDLRPRIDELARLSEPATALLFVSTGGETQLLRALVVLGFWDCPLCPEARSQLSAFVLPDHPAVTRLAVSCGALLDRTLGAANLDGLHRLGHASPELAILEALYRTLAEEFRFRWLRPEVSEPATRGLLYQTIRPPHRLLGTPGPRDISGSCLDLCLFVAGALENIGLCPVIVLLGEKPEQPEHALCGCWRGKLPGAQPVHGDRAALAGEIERGSMFLVDWTLAAGGTGETPMAFEGARSAASARIGSAAFISTVDIRTSRPPIGSMAPLRSELEPEVARAYAEAEVLSRDPAAAGGLVATLDLFIGLLRANGEVTRLLFEQAGLDVGRAIWSLQTADQTGRDRRDDQVLTRNALAVRARAESLARVAGSPSVREQDLLWAVLLGRHENRRFAACCAGAGIDLDRLAKLLSEKRPCVWTPDTESPDSADQCDDPPSIDGPTSRS